MRSEVLIFEDIDAHDHVHENVDDNVHTDTGIISYVVRLFSLCCPCFMY